ncbi:hypothetical protein BV898_15599 [Hypsibius exemplaris]|uniref:SLC12A transporter C-terminal domain-containing protein n=1 Tax=Hypsibius exemplaris TaxID=2072580 RepID=A0A9X6NBV0_HYPEX|nr:hypothetical protein BV898_15599 [Hypsibius exemplaris]
MKRKKPKLRCACFAPTVFVASLHVIERKFRNFSTGFNILESVSSPAKYVNPSSGGKELGAGDLVPNTGNEASSLKRSKIGWINGVVDLWAVQLFLRLPWLAGQAGMGAKNTSNISNHEAKHYLIGLLTSLSTSAITTNGEIGSTVLSRVVDKVARVPPGAFCSLFSERGDHAVARRNPSPTLEMAVLETMTSGMPPTLLVWGNQEDGLTYYC